MTKQNQSRSQYVAQITQQYEVQLWSLEDSLSALCTLYSNASLWKYTLIWTCQLPSPHRVLNSGGFRNSFPQIWRNVGSVPPGRCHFMSSSHGPAINIQDLGFNFVFNLCVCLFFDVPFAMRNVQLAFACYLSASVMVNERKSWDWK